MLDFGFGEIVVMVVVVLLVLGPRDMVKSMRLVGQFFGRAKGMVRQISQQIDKEIVADNLKELGNRSLINTKPTNLNFDSEISANHSESSINSGTPFPSKQWTVELPDATDVTDSEIKALRDELTQLRHQVELMKSTRLQVRPSRTKVRREKSAIQFRR